MKKYDMKKIIDEFDDDDFGFSAVSEDEYNEIINKKDQTVDEYKKRLQEVEKIILPFLTKLLKTADQPIIKWPNRKEVLEAQIQKILSLTRD
jgi:hypothetical protein